jgi:ectoine hydroxylase-related dioxygenase (phytanoyl-CoA dioxygenase family)
MSPKSSRYSLNKSELAAYSRDGYLVIKGLFDHIEVESLNQIVRADPVVLGSVYGRKDAAGGTAELVLWHDLREDMFSDVARSARVVTNLQKLLGGDVAFFHAKLTLKRPKTGGAWDWHQDYGYWYRTGYLFPHMASVFIALDPSKKENGCLQVLRGSHQLGRIEHGVNSEQVGADMVRVNAAMEKLELVHVEMDPGDALFFHCNLLHASGQNTSEQTRNVLLCCYNRVDNVPYMDMATSSHTPIEIVADDDIMRYADRPISREKTFHYGAPTA